MTTQDETFLVLSALGPDRPGLVARVTHYLTERGANVEDSRMVVLGGEFGILVLVSATPAELDAIDRDKAMLASETGLEIILRRTKSPEDHRRATTIPCVVTVEAIDQEGIVREVARALHDAGVNIVSVETSTYEAPVTGSPLFRMEARLDLPATVTVSHVRKAMAAVAEAANIDIEVRSLVRGG
ncbi:MAG TPA: ACT domain-containing protein [Polyangiaceae bacterium]|nr:ACT domain-containing protein [Polyangiaceae bacterium]